MFPISTSAFQVADGLPSKIRSRNIGVLVVFRSGAVKRIEAICFDGLHGRGWVSKILSALTNTWSISVQMSEPIAYKLDQVKELIVRYLELDQGLTEPALQLPKRLEEVSASILLCQSAGEIFDLINVPIPEDALDIL